MEMVHPRETFHHPNWLIHYLEACFPYLTVIKYSISNIPGKKSDDHAPSVAFSCMQPLPREWTPCLLYAQSLLPIKSTTDETSTSKMIRMSSTLLLIVRIRFFSASLCCIFLCWLRDPVSSLNDYALCKCELLHSQHPIFILYSTVHTSVVYDTMKNQVNPVPVSATELTFIRPKSIPPKQEMCWNKQPKVQYSTASCCDLRENPTAHFLHSWGI